MRVAYELELRNDQNMAAWGASGLLLSSLSEQFRSAPAIPTE